MFFFWFCFVHLYVWQRATNYGCGTGRSQAIGRVFRFSVLIITLHDSMVLLCMPLSLSMCAHVSVCVCVRIRRTQSVYVCLNGMVSIARIASAHKHKWRMCESGFCFHGDSNINKLMLILAAGWVCVSVNWWASGGAYILIIADAF